MGSEVGDNGLAWMEDSIILADNSWSHQSLPVPIHIPPFWSSLSKVHLNASMPGLPLNADTWVRFGELEGESENGIKRPQRQLHHSWHSLGRWVTLSSF